MKNHRRTLPALLSLLLLSCGTVPGDIWTAAAEGNVRYIRRAPAAELDAKQPGTGMSPLAVAIANNNVRAVRALIAAGADIYEESYSDFIFIMVQNATEMKEDVRPFLDAGAVPDLSTTINDYRLFMTLDRTEENAAFFDSLLAWPPDRYYRPRDDGLGNARVSGSGGGDSNYGMYHNYRLYRLHSPLKQAVYRQRPEIVRLLLGAAGGKDYANRRYTYMAGGSSEDQPEYANHTPLTLAIGRGNRETAGLLLDAGARTGDEEGESNRVYVFAGRGRYLTPLAYAIELGDAGMVAFLLERGLDPNHPGSHALYNAIGAPDILRLLLDAGADPNFENRHRDYAPLPRAVQRKDAEAARILMEAGADANRNMDFGDTLLTCAVRNDDAVMVRLLLGGGADINRSRRGSARPGDGRHTPLTRAIADSSTEMIRLLLDAGADPDAPGQYDRGPLQTAITEKNGPLIRELLEAGAKVNPPAGTPPLLLAAEQGDIPLMRLLLDRGADIRGEDPGGETVLACAAGAGDLAFFREILTLARARGIADIDFHGRGGRTALQSAMARGNLETARFLVSLGADVNAGIETGHTPLYFALRHRKPEDRAALAEILTKAGADVNAFWPELHDEHRYGYYMMSGRFTPLMVMFDDREVIELLLGAGADPDIRDGEGRTALMLHSYINRGAGCVEALIDAGADVNAKNRHGETALMYGITGENRNWDIVEALLAAGADVNARADAGDTALMLGTEWSYLSSDGIRRLISAGADAAIQDDDGATALMKKVHYVPHNNLWTHDSGYRMEETAALLGRGGAGINLKDRHGWTALMYAAANHAVPAEALRLMVEAGAEVNAESPEGITALMLLQVEQRIMTAEFSSASPRYAEKIRVLVELGASEKPPVISRIPSHSRYRGLRGTEGLWRGDH